MSSTTTTTSTASPPHQRFTALLDEVKVSKDDFNHLIMDYFVSQGYPQAAQKFAAEANMHPMPDVHSITQRVEIRHAIHSGDIQSAIERINEYNPQLLDGHAPLHFALLRLQLIELIRSASQSNGDITPVIEFATAQLAPRAPTNSTFLADLEETMALLIFKQEDLTPPLKELLQPSLRRKIAKDVNEALLVAGGEKAFATLGDLISTRAWTQQLATKEKKDIILDNMDLGLDPSRQHDQMQNENGSSPLHGTDGDAMATGWDGQS